MTVSIHFTAGKTKGKKGGLKKHRNSSNLLSLTFTRGGEHQDYYKAAIQGPREYAASYHPRVAKRLAEVIRMAGYPLASVRLHIAMCHDV